MHTRELSGKPRPIPDHVSFSQVWSGRGVGRFWKRQLSKARRRYAKQMIRFGRARSIAGYESECNWKTW